MQTQIDIVYSPDEDNWYTQAYEYPSGKLHRTSQSFKSKKEAAGEVANWCMHHRHEITSVEVLD